MVCTTRTNALLAGAAAAALLAHPALAQVPAPAVTPLDAVTTSATRTSAVAGDAATSVSIVDKSEIERRQGQSIDDLVKDLPGVDANGVPRNTVKQITIRGLSDERVVIRLDGVRDNFSSGHRGRIFLDPDLLKQVDVVRGPGSLLFGSGAMGGALNMRTIDAEDILKKGATLGGRAKIGYQTNNSERLASLTGAARVQGADVVANLTRRTNGNYHDGAGNDISYSGDEIWSGLFKVGYDLAPGNRIGFSTVQFRDDHTIPLDANTSNPTATTSITDRDTLQHSYAVNWAYASPTNRAIDLKTNIYRNEVEIYERGISPASTAARRDLTKLRTNGYDLQNTSHFALGGIDAHALTYGFDGYVDNQESSRNGAPRTDYPAAEQRVYGLFVQDEVDFGRWATLTPGIRYDRARKDASGSALKSDVEHFSPKTSLAVHVTPWMSPYVSYAEAFRVPSLTELYIGGQHFPGNNWVANPNLRPETAENKEGGVNLRFSDVVLPGDRLRARAAYFVNDIEDYIQEVVTATTSTVTNVSSARIKGGELEMRYDARTWFSAVGASALRGENLVTNQPLSDTPADKLSFTLGYRFLDNGITLGGRSITNAPQNRVPTDTITTGGYTVWDVFASWQPTEPMLQDFRFDLAVDNLFDKAYRRSNWNSSTAKFYESGRNAKLAVSWRF
ncbi:MAG: TonB-dependent hemoglobin/transferrin/lactoferrin family receptor [Alphaproteobacteria bacterium]|nr:TonB-dependent hemoglobin/transferrin/lactoferrin family receptor [Alphaproteobacteria bacterium]